MKIWIISDTHGFHNQLNIPQCDMVIHCGDESNSFNPYENELQARNFFEWYRVLPIKHKVFIPGNHSTAIFNKLIRKEEYPELIWLEHESANVEGVNFFGSPYTPRYGNSCAFMYKRNIGKVYWDAIPDDTQVLITHGPPKTILDLTDDKETNNLVQVGCKSLYNRVMEVKPLIHCFGHIHSEKNINNQGIYQKSISETKFINAACLNHHTMEIYQGHIIYI